MPDKNIVYCIQVDYSGRMVNSHLLTPQQAQHILEDAKRLLDERREEL